MRQAIHIVGPCSAESREQVLLTARQLKEACGELPFIYRAGVWKPRTNPKSFQGAGKKGLVWLKEVQEMGIPVAVEVATPEHLIAALDAEMDYLWIGARTSANPIAVQELAYTLSMQHFYPRAVFIKNPVNADTALWLGNIERFELASVPVRAIHRGCNHKPCWAMAHQLRLARPDIPLLIDPSHMSGDAEQVPELLAKAAELGYDGEMVEVHCNPAAALSDAKQQITSGQYQGNIGVILDNNRDFNGRELKWLRAEMDEIDDQLWNTIAERMDISRRIGEWKKANNVPPLQPMRYQQILAQRQEWATKNGIAADFVEQVLDLIHQESLRIQKH